MLRLHKLKKHFGGVKAVDGCSFHVKKGSITALIGPNGAGKSTVFNLISGVLKPDSGTIMFDGEDVTGLPTEKIANKGISRLFQQARLFNNLTVKENLELAINAEDVKFWKSFLGKSKTSKAQNLKISKMLKLIGLTHFENRLARDLSYGQKRLLELARTILKPHKLLMLDEPVAGVNPKLRIEIANLLLRLKKQADTVLLIEHDMEFALGISDTVIVMDEGKVIAHGSPEEIKNNPKVLEAYLGD